MSNDTKTKTTYCPNCDADREVRITVPWQDDFCLECGENVDG
ncbi:hypothetical protein [Natrinema sp. CBA1119]|nr:hypothetical protein [Natrinema sp. CBA1119]